MGTMKIMQTVLGLVALAAVSYAAGDVAGAPAKAGAPEYHQNVGFNNMLLGMLGGARQYRLQHQGAAGAPQNGGAQQNAGGQQNEEKPPADGDKPDWMRRLRYEKGQ